MMACNTEQTIIGFADIIFPPRCSICGTLLDGNRATSFCRACRSGMTRIEPPLCSCCGTPFEGPHAGDHLCGECLSGVQHMSVARAFGKYDGTLMAAIHLFKYRGKSAVGHALGKLMANHIYKDLNIKNYTVIIPVPLHPKRLRERGFNQSLILARHLGRKYAIPVDFMTLKRRKHTDPQILLKRNQRMSNVRGAFEVTVQDNIAGQRIILVDDVYTTGSTVQECCRTLIRHDAQDVAVITLARA